MPHAISSRWAARLVVPDKNEVVLLQDGAEGPKERRDQRFLRSVLEKNHCFGGCIWETTPCYIIVIIVW
jgi:hypothetical protein